MKDNNPLFSILIANFNNSNFLRTAIKSALNQTYENIEIVIVDDCSEDNFEAIINEFKGNKKIKVYRNSSNSGCGYSKRKCVELSTGDIFGFLDPDDALANIAVMEMINSHNTHKTASLIYSNLYVCDENLHNLYEQKKRQVPEGVTILKEPKYKIHHFATIKRDFYNRTDKIDSYLKRAVDRDLYLKMEEVGKLVHLDKTLYSYRTHSKGLSSESNYYKANAWFLYVLINTIERRKEDYEKIMENYLIQISRRNSIDSKIGKSILQPYRLFKKLFK